MAPFLLIGLGNPASQHHGTRHNLGIETLRSWVESVSGASPVTAWSKNSSGTAETAAIILPAVKVTCLFPLTGMNKSGQAVATLNRRSWWQLKPPFEAAHTLILHDDIELDPGQVKLKPGGSARGHNGVRSIHQALGITAIPRLLLGIGRPSGRASREAYRPSDKNISDYVLSPFTTDEQKIIADETLPRALQLINNFITHSK